MGITAENIDAWTHERFLKNNMLNKQIANGKTSPLWQIFAMSKQKSGGGKDYEMPQWGSQKRTSGRHHRTVVARDAAGATGDRQVFKYNMIQNFDRVSTDRYVQQANAGEPGSFFDALENDIMQSVASMSIDIIKGFYGDQSIGQIGQVSTVAIASNKKSATLTFTGSTSMIGLEKNMIIELAAAKYDGSTDSRRKSVGTDVDAKLMKIGNVNWDTSQVTVTPLNGANFTDSGAVNPAKDDYVWKEGEYINISPLKTQRVGLYDYAPETLSAGENFLDGDRSVSPHRLAMRYMGTSAPASTSDAGEVIYDAVVKSEVGVTRFFPEYGITHIVANPVVKAALQLSKIFKTGVRWIENDATKKRVGAIGFSAFHVLGSKGDLPMIFDPFCPEHQVFGFYGPAFKVKYLSFDNNLVSFKQQSGSRVILDHTDNVNKLFLENYMFLCNSLMGCGFRINVGPALTGFSL